MSTRGFVTLAVGDIKYYKLAANLLKSYKIHSKCKSQWAIIADRENEYTLLFDKAIIIENSQKNYMDKLTMLSIPPFDENIFIDADCLAYRDLDQYWKIVENRGGYDALAGVCRLIQKMVGLKRMGLENIRM